MRTMLLISYYPILDGSADPDGIYIYIYLLAILNHTITVVTNITANLSDICH